tara:strand:- start:513 stop:677 length:165 start_codon:yes stop_codon:yes gene_type:complete
MIEVKLFLLDSEIAEVLENIESLQHLQTFISFKKEILKKYESKKAIEQLENLTF